VKKYNIGIHKIVKDTNSVGLIESGIPRITYPWSFTNDYFNIEQDFYCDANSVPTFVHSLPHSKYPLSKSVSQSSAQIVSTGLATFTRKYVQFPNTPIQRASTATVTFPSIAQGINYYGRGIETVTETYQKPLTATITLEDGTTRTTTQMNKDGSIATVTAEREVPAVTSWYRKHSVTKVVPVVSSTSFIYMGSTMETKQVLIRSVSAGARIGNRIVASNDYNAQEQRYYITFEDRTMTSGGRNSNIQVSIPVYNVGSIEVDEPFKIIDDYSEYKGAEVEFIDDFTIPKRTEFLARTNQDKLLFTSQITHIEGFLYTKENIYGKIQ
jgi:hypothetical protein